MTGVFDMLSRETINGAAALRSVCRAYNDLRADVLNTDALLAAAAELAEQLCAENGALASLPSLGCPAAPEMEIGRCAVPLSADGQLGAVLSKNLAPLVKNGCLSLPVRLDLSGNVRVFIEVEDHQERASELAQYLLLSMLKQNASVKIRCVDLVSGGSFFSYIHSLIAKFPGKTGGCVYDKFSELDGLFRSLDDDAANALKILGGSYATVYDYNRANTVKIPEFVHVFRLQQPARGRDELDRLKVLLRNGPKSGMSFILVGDRQTAEQFAADTDCHILLRGDSMLLDPAAGLPFFLSDTVAVSENMIAPLISSMQSSESVDTLFEHHPELQTDYLTMDSGPALRIPFAIDKNNIVQYFEIGGNAPSHALIAGATGSGKSVALHTLILQIVRNYHPDDVEIWAIDYKAVEFDGYLRHRTPHFRVIAHDTSDEFSLSLLDKLYGEYESRMEKFLRAGVKNIHEYRAKMGAHSMPRIIVFIDEFQLMTQAVSAYTGHKDYRVVLENLLKLTRAMGISFILCSQTIASGLSGLTDAARDQIGCRLCLKHDDDNEIRETLMLSGPDAADLVYQAKELRRGQGIYKRARWADEFAPDGKAYEFKKIYILYIGDALKEKTINDVNLRLGGNYTPKEEIFVRGGGRIGVAEKVRHPLSKFLTGGYEPEPDCLEWYPAAPTTLDDAFRLKLENAAGANLLMVGEDDALRDSVIFHSICGFLMAPSTRIVASFIDEKYPDRARMIAQLRGIRSDRLVVNACLPDTLSCILSLKKIRPLSGENRVYLWYGLDKLKNELFLMHQEHDEDESPSGSTQAPVSREDMLADLMGFLSEINGASAARSAPAAAACEELTFDDCKSILSRFFDAGPENSQYSLAVFNNRKAIKNSGIVSLECFENRIGTKMSVDDSYDLFGSSLAVGKTDENTVIYYAGSGQVTPLRPYLMPDGDWLAAFNNALSHL